MSTAVLEMRASLRRLSGAVTAHLAPLIVTTMTGSLLPLQAAVEIDLDPIADPAPFLTLDDPRLIGARLIAQGPGSTILVGTDTALVIVDATARDSLRIVASRTVDFPVLALQTVGGYVLAICGQFGARQLLVCRNDFALPTLLQEELAASDHGAWIAGRADGYPVFAYPDGDAVALCALDGQFSELARLHGVALDGMRAAWADLVALERPTVADTVERLRYLVLVHDHGGVASILEHRTLFTDPGSRLPDARDVTATFFRHVSAVGLEDAEVPLSLTTLPIPLYVRGSITSPLPVEPVFDSATELPDGRWLLSWGYNNPNTDIVYIPAGGMNQLGDFSGLPAQFFPGRVYTAVSVIVDASQPVLSWVVGALAEPADYNAFLSLGELDPRDQLIYVPRAVRPVLDVFTLADPDVGPQQRTSYDARDEIPLSDAVRDTLEPNEDVPFISRWRQRWATARIAGGWFMVHGPAGYVSRVYDPDFVRELL